MHKLLIVSGLLFAAGGCKNSNYCAGNPDNNCNEHPGDAPKQIDGMEALDCTVAGCGDSGKVCDPGTKACVECTVTESAACTGTSPVCKNDACTACVANPDCPSNTCEPSGACASADEVAWVALGGTGDCLTQTTACGSIAMARGTTRTIIHVTGHIAEPVAVGPSGTLMIIGDRDGSGNITSGLAYGAGTLLAASGSASVTLVDMELDGLSTATYGVASASTGTIELDHVAIHNTTDYGVYATGGGITIHRGNIHDNKKAGIDLFGATFAIDNTFIVTNGALSSLSLGGVSLSQSHGTLNFSTIANNAGNTAGAKGVACSNVGDTFTSDVVYGNSVGQAGGDCVWTYSDFDTVTGAAPPGSTNMTVSPMFIDGDNGNFHLANGSPMRDMGDPSSTLPIDIDDNARPQGARRDIGADELMP
jgi:hypothetical protein